MPAVVLDHDLCDGDGMTLITFQGGKAVVRDGKVGTEADCCCGCPPGCPSLAGCNLIVTLMYNEPLPIEYGPASDYYDSALCTLAFEVADIPFESGGDIDALFTIEYDGNCNPIATNGIIVHAADCENPIVNCVDVTVTLDCNPLP